MTGFRNYEKGLYKQLEELMSKLEEALNDNKTLKHDVKKLLNKEKEYQNTIQKLLKEIERLKAIINKDSSNSSKPSSTNGFKKVITNRREKSNKPVGKQKGDKSTNLSEEKVQKLISSGNVEKTVIEVNKNESNKNKAFKSIRVIDLKIVKQIKEYRYYPDENGRYNIPEYHNRPIQYGNNLKAICCILMNEVYNSTDGTSKFISDITNEGIEVSKGTLINWNKELSNKLSVETENIEEKLLSSYYLNNDESQIKINGNGYNTLCACNKTHTRLWIHQHKSQEALKEIGFLSNYTGIIVKDGTDLYNGFGMFLAQCASHILRYLKGIYDNVDHPSCKEMADFLKRIIHERKVLISKDIKCYEEKEYQKIYDEYHVILKKWKKEWMKDALTNPVYDEERKLLTRMEDDDKDQILYFIKDFKIPATNNQAEVGLRNIKIKQKIGKFRSVSGAECYAINRSCISTYKKNKINVLDAIKKAFINETVII